MNLNNFGTSTGRLTREPVVFENKDGSRKVLFTLAVPNNYKNKEGKRDANFIAYEGFVNADKVGLGVYDYMHTGDLVSVSYSVRSKNYTRKDGTAVYEQILQVEDVELRESQKKGTKAVAETAEMPADQPFTEA